MRWPRRSKHASGTNKRSGSTTGRCFEGFANRPLRLRECGRRAAKGERRAAIPAQHDRQGGRESFRRPAQPKAGACPARRAAGERLRQSGTPEAREAQSLLGEATAESGAGGRLNCPSPDKGVAAQGRSSDRRWSRSRAVADPKKAVRHKARSRDGRWTVIPGAYVSRWEPYAEAHEPRQGQPPEGSYGPEECCPDAPPSSARRYLGASPANG